MSATDEDREALQTELLAQQDIRQPVTVRLKPEAKALWSKHCAKAGLEPGTAARVIIELMVEYMRSGPDFIDALYALKNTLKPLPLESKGRSK